MTAGSTILGVYAMEGMHHYPFGLDRIEPALTRRITNADALAHLRRGEPEGVEPREFSTIEVGEAADRLQQLEVQRFLGVLKSDIAYYWEASVQERKLDILFADPELKIRDILFLLGQALFEPEESFETIFRLVQRNHPLRASNIPHILVLANRYYYLDVLGLNPGLLFTRSAHASGGAWTPIEEAGAFGVRTLLHVGTAIHLQVGDELFRAAPVAWRILLGQYDGKVDAVIQDLTFLLDGFDSLLAIMGSMRPDLRGWVGPLVDALAEDAADLPPTDASGPPKGVLRLTTRATLDRCRERLNQFCLMALWRCAEAAQVSPINVLQNLRLPRTKTDKLRALLEQGRQEPRKQRNRDLRLRVRR
jgi:hypothetical protein